MVLVGSACRGAGTAPEAKQSPVPRGGTLKVGLFRWNGDTPYDPATFASLAILTIYPCCLQRTLYYYNGRPGDEGGGLVRPDLATGPPEVSADGLTWTIRIRRGLRYAPPLQNAEITAPDFIRAIQRALSPAPKELQSPSGLLGPDYFLEIEGAQDYADGKAEAI